MCIFKSIDMREGLMFMFNLGPLRNFGSPVPAISSCFWMTSLFLLIINLPMQFYYRYQMLCTGRTIKLVQFGRIYACAFCYVFLQSCLFSLVYYNRAEETIPYKHVLQKNPLYTEDTPRFIVGDTVIALEYYVIRLIFRKRPQHSYTSRTLNLSLLSRTLLSAI